MVEHVAITDPNIHETKGVAGATDGQVHARLAGVGAWVTPSDLITQRQVNVLEAFHTTAQNPAGLDTPLGVLWGGPQIGTDVSLDSGGIITINTTGFYILKFNLSFGRTTGAGEAVLVARLLVNGTPTGFVQGVRLPDQNTSNVSQFDVNVQLAATTTIQVQIMRDSTGVDNGGLLPLVTTPVGWADVPSAWVRVSRLIGVSA